MKRPNRVNKTASLKDWLKHALPGSRINYHEGNLAESRQLDSELDTRARLLWIASEVYGTVHLTQQRIGPHVCRYIATKGK
jgi:hypothetical protein